MPIEFIIVCGIFYAIGWVVCGRMFAGHLAWRWAKDWNYKKPDGGQWLGASVFGGLAGVAWPLYAVVYWTIKVANNIVPVIGAERRHLEAIAKTKPKVQAPVEKESTLRCAGDDCIELAMKDDYLCKACRKETKEPFSVKRRFFG